MLTSPTNGTTIPGAVAADTAGDFIVAAAAASAVIS
jgi:hypothetical protein